MKGLWRKEHTEGSKNDVLQIFYIFICFLGVVF